MKKNYKRKLTKILKKKGGRNNQGKITVRHRGGGHKRRYRLINNQIKDNIKIKEILYDPNRSTNIALVENNEINTEKLIISPLGGKKGDIITPMKLKDIPIGQNIYNIEIRPNEGGKLVRSGGSQAKILTQKKEITEIKLPSGKILQLNNNCMALLGIPSPLPLKLKGKAGINRRLGIRPTVKGEAMNPIDHPHGGKTRGGILPKSPWSKLTHGKKTRKKNKIRHY